MEAIVGRSKMFLGDLTDPATSCHSLDVDESDLDFALEALECMIAVRSVEETIGRWVEQGKAKTPCHLGIGQEAIAAGVSPLLTAQDRIYGTHRSHSHFLALNHNVYGLLAEVLGKADGASRGMGGSMHLYDGANGFQGSVPIVGATIPLAVGAGLAAKMDGSEHIGVCYFGDGTSEEGLFHESLNFASAYEIPVLFVCENNLYSSHLDIKYRQPADRIARFADAHIIRAVTVDGNDVIAVAEAAKELIDHSRQGNGPGFLEAVTYRWRGHVGPDANIDVGVRRKKEDLEAWMKCDPIERLVAGLCEKGLYTRDAFSALDARVRGHVKEMAERAERAPYPSEEQLMSIVYANDARPGVH